MSGICTHTRHMRRLSVAADNKAHIDTLTYDYVERALFSLGQLVLLLVWVCECIAIIVLNLDCTHAYLLQQCIVG